jgi:hypothetical protein
MRLYTIFEHDRKTQGNDLKTDDVVNTLGIKGRVVEIFRLAGIGQASSAGVAGHVHSLEWEGLHDNEEQDRSLIILFVTRSSRT